MIRQVDRSKLAARLRVPLLTEEAVLEAKRMRSKRLAPSTPDEQAVYSAGFVDGALWAAEFIGKENAP